VSQKQLPHLIQISSPDTSKKGTVVMLERVDEDEAMRVAQMLARETGRRVTLRDAKLALIETIPAVSIH
jgi:hypothetical protein